MYEFDELKSKVVIAGVGLGIMILAILAVLREVFKTPAHNEASYLFPVLVALVLIAVVSTLFAFLAFAPMLKSAYERISILQQGLGATLNDDYQLVTELSNELSNCRAVLTQTETTLESARTSIAELQVQEKTRQALIEQTASAAATEETHTTDDGQDSETVVTKPLPAESPTVDVGKIVAEVVDKLLNGLSEHNKNMDSAWQRIVEQQARLHEKQLEIATSVQQADSKSAKPPAQPKKKDIPKPQSKTQDAVRQISVARVNALRARQPIPELQSLCNQCGITRKQFGEHVPQLLSHWTDKSYRKFWEYDVIREVWEEIEVSEKFS